MLIADKKDYKRGYKKHFGLYKRLHSEHADSSSRRLLLIYSVECGLKRGCEWCAAVYVERCGKEIVIK